MSRNHRRPGSPWKVLLCFTSLVGILALAGCSKEGVKRASDVLGPGATATASAPSVVKELSSTTPPTGLQTISFNGQQLTLWPYDGKSFDGVPENPVNLIFVGKADPVAIRAALLALPPAPAGSGMPDVFPFNSTWSDANGDVQAAYGDGEGWVGNAVQLQLGRYEYGRVHLRLFRTGKAFGSEGGWTIGAAEFEILIPNTADHQVLSWELARAAVVRDLVRTGLLDATTPMADTPVISQTPTFRNIPDYIYGPMPMDLKMLIFNGNPPNEASPGILSDGKATILHLAGSAPITPGTVTDAFTLQYGQLSPKPFCSSGPLDYVYLQGPVNLSKTVTVDASGALQYTSTILGRIAVTPMDVTANPPAPSGQTYYANVSDEQSGWINSGRAWVTQQMKRLGNPSTGAQMVMWRLRVSTDGEDQYRIETRCLGPEP